MIPAAVLLGLAAAAAAPVNLCNLCHPEIRVEFEHSIHSSEEVLCVSCHGGDPAGDDVDTAHRGNFRGKIARRDIPALCASCHADSDRMGPYNLPTDQLALYQTSHHGRAVARGDNQAAVCTDCHGVHEIFRSDDARSRVFPANIPATCSGCHSDPAVKERHGWTEDPYEDFISSRHGQALLERQDRSAPECSRCHGAHGAAPPGVGDVNKVCGQCHPTVRSYFRDSPHRRAMNAAHLPECASCHDPHRTTRAGVDMLERTCLKCHNVGSEAAEMGIRMKTLYTTASDDLGAARHQVNEAAAIPLYVEDYLARVEEAHTSLIESLPAMHSLDLGLVEQLTGRTRSIAHEVESEVRSKLEGRKWRRVGLLVFWFYLLVTLGTLVRFRQRAARKAAA